MFKYQCQACNTLATYISLDIIYANAEKTMIQNLIQVLVAYCMSQIIPGQTDVVAEDRNTSIPIPSAMHSSQFKEVFN